MAQGEIKTALIQAAEPFVENLYHCLRCNYCVEMHWEERGIQHVCPTLVHHNPAPGYSGKGYLAAARAMLEGEELPINSLIERFFNCTTCGNCEEVCPVGLQPAHLVKQMRSAMVAQGLAPEPIAVIGTNVIEHHNPAAAPLEDRNRWAARARRDSRRRVHAVPSRMRRKLRCAGRSARDRVRLASNRCANKAAAS